MCTCCTQASPPSGTIIALPTLNTGECLVEPCVRGLCIVANQSHLKKELTIIGSRYFLSHRYRCINAGGRPSDAFPLTWLSQLQSLSSLGTAWVQTWHVIWGRGDGNRVTTSQQKTANDSKNDWNHWRSFCSICFKNVDFV